MNDRIERATGVVTSVSLVAAALLLAPAFAGLSPSLPLAAGTLALAVLAAVFRAELRSLPDQRWLQSYLGTVWLGPLVATIVLVAFLGATPAELQTLGAVVGLIGMFNYLLRPVYFALGGVLSRVVRTT